MTTLSRSLNRGGLTALLVAYTAFTIFPIVWVGMMSGRTTTEIAYNHYAWPNPFHWAKFRAAWIDSEFSTYFANSAEVVIGSVVVITLVGAAAAHCLARYRFPGNRLIYFILFSSIILPPQIVLIAVYQILVEYNLYDTLWGLGLVYVSLQLPLTIYLLEGFFVRIPQDLFDAAKVDGYGDVEIFVRLVLPIGMPAIATTVILNFILLWNEFLFATVLISDDEFRTLPVGIQQFMGDHFQDIGMIATGVMISVIPVIVVYGVFSEKLIQGMTVGAVK